jgi:hypothetical protein
MLRITVKLQKRLRKLSKALIDASMEAEDIKDEVNAMLEGQDFDFDESPQGKEQERILGMLDNLTYVLENIADNTNDADSELIFSDAYEYKQPVKKKKGVAKKRKTR